MTSEPETTRNGKTRPGMIMALAGLTVGIGGDLLLRAEPGINVALWTVLLVGAIALITSRVGVRLRGEGRWLLLVAPLVAGAFAWRNSPMLLGLDFVILVFTTILAVATAPHGSLRLQGVADLALRMGYAGLHIAFGPLLLLLGDISWSDMQSNGRSKSVMAVVRGLLLAVPLLLVFGGLFSAADQVFNQAVTEFFSFDFERLIEHLLVTFFFGWIAAGVLRTVTWAGEPNLRSLGDSVSKPVLGRTETAVVLGSLNVLFASFVAIQFRYLFGGAALVQATTGLTYAEYARRGFFELVTVAALLLPLLLLLHWLIADGDRRGQQLFRWLAGVLVGLMYAVMASAFFRMGLYQQAFGQTELRFFVTSFMIWMAVIFLWFAATVLRGQRQRFLFGVIVTGYIALAVLHGINPDAYITGSNLQHVEKTGTFDAYYNVSLTADAVPVLVMAVDQLPAEQRAFVAQALLDRWSAPESPDWRSWNWGRCTAWRSVEQNRTMLERAAAEAAKSDKP